MGRQIYRIVRKIPIEGIGKFGFSPPQRGGLGDWEILSRFEMFAYRWKSLLNRKFERCLEKSISQLLSFDPR
jgi:hypothetical protein